MKRHDYIMELVGDLNLDSYEDVNQYVNDLRNLLNSHVNYLMFMNGDKPIEDHPQYLLIKKSLDVLEK